MELESDEVLVSEVVALLAVKEPVELCVVLKVVLVISDVDDAMASAVALVSLVELDMSLNVLEDKLCPLVEELSDVVPLVLASLEEELKLVVKSLVEVVELL